MTTSFLIKNTAFASLDMQGADTAPLSPIDFLTRAAHVFGDKAAIIYEDRRLDYQTVYPVSYTHLTLPTSHNV